jgi:hypothetical protein
MNRYAHKIGAISYILWGVVHIWGGVLMLYRLGREGGTQALAVVGSAVPFEELPQKFTGLENAILGQHAWNLAVFGWFALIIGVWMNWRNSRMGYWLNLGVVSAVDVAYVYAILLPGYISLRDGLWGPIFWILGVIFSTIGYLTRSDESSATSSESMS